METPRKHMAEALSDDEGIGIDLKRVYIAAEEAENRGGVDCRKGKYTEDANGEEYLIADYPLNERMPLKEREFWMLHSYDGRSIRISYVAPHWIADDEAEEWEATKMETSEGGLVGSESQNPQEYITNMLRESKDFSERICHTKTFKSGKSETRIRLKRNGKPDDYPKSREALREELKEGTERKSSMVGGAIEAMYGSRYLRRAIETLSDENGDMAEEQWQVLEFAFKAGRHYEEFKTYKSSRSIAKSGMPMHRQRNTKGSSKKSWRARAKELIKKSLISNERVCSKGIAEKLKAEELCDFEEWGKGMEINFYEDKPEDLERVDYLPKVMNQRNFSDKISKMKKELS